MLPEPPKDKSPAAQAPENRPKFIDKLSRNERIAAGIVAITCIVELIGFATGARQDILWPIIGILSALLLFILSTIELISGINSRRRLRRLSKSDHQQPD